ncbi:hypothetical protein [Niabella sp.]|uniref:hypothetical protein n=1 Tax=Niabella sp. TaxID=1962976 RepID=UPI00261D1872|nr:hypothetical protein [Niabella sp.]
MKTGFLFTFIYSILLFSCAKTKEYSTADLSLQATNRQPALAITKAARYPPLKQYITTITWRGARVWYTPGAAWVDSVLSVNFYGNGRLEWVKQGWEYVPRLPGTYSIQGNNITIRFRYPPYTHQLEGVYDRNTGAITGTFTETRDPASGAPPAYIPGTITGTFNFYKK